MNETVQALAQKVLRSRADKGFWKTKAIEEALAWSQGKARELKIKWNTAWNVEIRAMATKIYEEKGLNDRGQKS